MRTAKLMENTNDSRTCPWLETASRLSVALSRSKEKNSFVGAKSVIRENITIGKNVIIGAGSVVVKDVPDNVKVVGNPARFIKYN